MKSRKYLILAFFCLLVITISAQGTKQENTIKGLKFRNISLKEGLSQSSVLSILQDKKGFLWFGTRDGLNRYDGQTFNIFRYDSQDSTSISHSYVKSLFEDKEGTIWVGTVNGLNRFIPETNSFQRFYFSKSKNTTNNEIWSIVQEDKRHLWLGTDKGLKKFNTTDGHLVTLSNAENQDGLFYNPTQSLLKVGNTLWIKTTEYVGIYDLKSKHITQFKFPKNDEKRTFRNNPAALYLDTKNTIWLGSVDGLAYFDQQSRAFKPFKTSSNEVINDEVRSIYEDHSGTFWVGTYKGLYIINKEKNSVSQFVHDENNPSSLSQNSIYDVIEDSRGDIWIGTYAGGVNYYDRSYDLFKHFTAGTNNSKLNYKVVSTIVEDDKQNLWIGTEGGGINFFDTKTDRFTYYTYNPANSKSLSTNNVKAMIRDRNGNFWIGTHDGGLNFVNSKKRPYTFEKYLHLVNDPHSLSNNRVISLFEGPNQNIWIGTSGGGLNVLNPQNNMVSRISDSLQIVGKIIYTISSPYRNNELLVGGENGLAKIDVNTRQWIPLSYLSESSNNAVSRAILCTYLDSKNILWIGTEGDGLYALNEKTNKSIRYGIAEGLASDVVYGIVPDGNGTIWMSTNNGLSQLDLMSHKFKNYNVSDGLQSNEYNYGAYLKRKNEDIIFGGANGFDVINPRNIQGNSFIPPVSITSLAVNNKPFLNITEKTNVIVLNHDQNDFNFEFIALSYSQPDKNQYAYKLDGFDKEWNYIGNKTSATYTNMDAGKYTFKVKAANDNGLWNETGASVSLSLKPAPWHTWWAYLIYLLLLIALGYVIRRFLSQRIKDRNQIKLERIENERIEGVNRMKLELFTNISHDFRTPLTLILGPLKQMIVANEGNEHIREQHATMHRNVNVLMELINQLLDFRKSEAGKLEVHAAEHDLVSFVEEVKLSFNHLAKKRNIEFSLIAADHQLNAWFDRIMLRKVLFNLLSNAFKFTDNYGKIEIEIDEVKKLVKSMPSGYLRIKVRDNGKGIPKKNIAYVFERFYQLGDRFGTGIGLTLTKNLVELHKGTITVKSNENKGTHFTIRLQKGNNHFSPEQLREDVNKIDESGLYNFEDPALINKLSINTNSPAFNDMLPSVLIVEDNVEVRQFLNGMFRDLYNIFTAADGSEGIEVAKKSDIDLIISDVMMPVMDGVTFCKEIKTNIRTSHIPVILLTARTSEEYQTTGYKTGADAYITKPFDTEILKIRVKNLIQSRRKLIEKFKKDLILQPKEVTTSTADEDFLQKAIDIVEQNITDPDFSITGFIDEIGMSRSVFYKKLKSLTDQSISEFIRTIKLKRAAQLMEQSDMNISEIAYELGFHDMKYFRQSFKTVFKMTPSEYRQSKLS